MKESRTIRGVDRFFRTALRSMTDLRFFREALRKRPSDAVGYLVVLLIITWLIPFSVNFFMGVRSVNDAVVSGLRSHFPADATFVMKDGKLTNDLEAPIVIEDHGFNLIVNTATTTLELDEDMIGLVVNSDAIIQRESRDRVQIIGYSDLPDFEIDRRGADGWLAAYGPWIVFFVSTAAVMAFALALALGFGIFVVIHAVILYAMMRLMKRPLRYARAFTVAAYASTVPIVVKALGDWSGADIGSVPTMLYWIILGFIIYDFRKGGLNGQQASKPQKADRPSEDTGGRG